jgi:hypothetical protein
MISCVADQHTMKTIDVLTFLIGQWNVSRHINDFRANIIGRFNGGAIFIPVMPTTLSFHEAGEMTYGSFRGPCERTLKFYQLNSRSVQVRFADDRPLVEIDFNDTTTPSTHLCGQDRYEITLRVLSDDVIEETWRVHGPTKDYDAIARWTRVSENPKRESEELDSRC